MIRPNLGAVNLIEALYYKHHEIDFCLQNTNYYLGTVNFLGTLLPYMRQIAYDFAIAGKRAEKQYENALPEIFDEICLKYKSICLLLYKLLIVEHKEISVITFTWQDYIAINFIAQEALYVYENQIIITESNAAYEEMNRNCEAVLEYDRLRQILRDNCKQLTTRELI